MSPELQRIKIAEACGWETNKRKWLAKPPSNSWQYLDTIPNYLNDLNAIHEAKKILTDKQWVIYSAELWKITNNPLHATAEECAEAFLKTLNLWEE